MAASESPKDSKLKRDKGRDLKLVGTIVAGKYKILKILGQGGYRRDEVAPLAHDSRR